MNAIKAALECPYLLKHVFAKLIGTAECTGFEVQEEEVKPLPTELDARECPWPQVLVARLKLDTLHKDNLLKRATFPRGNQFNVSPTVGYSEVVIGEFMHQQTPQHRLVPNFAKAEQVRIQGLDVIRNFFHTFMVLPFTSLFLFRRHLATNCREAFAKILDIPEHGRKRRFSSV